MRKSDKSDLRWSSPRVTRDSARQFAIGAVDRQGFQSLSYATSTPPEATASGDQGKRREGVARFLLASPRAFRFK